MTDERRHDIASNMIATYCQRCHRVDPDMDGVCKPVKSKVWVSKETGKPVCKICRHEHE